MWLHLNLSSDLKIAENSICLLICLFICAINQPLLSSSVLWRELKEEMQEISVSFSPRWCRRLNLAQMLINANKSNLVTCFKVPIRDFYGVTGKIHHIVCLDL